MLLLLLSGCLQKRSLILCFPGPGTVCCSRHGKANYGDRVQWNHPQKGGRRHEREDLQISSKTPLCLYVLLWGRHLCTDHEPPLTEPCSVHVPHRQRACRRCHPHRRVSKVQAHFIHAGSITVGLWTLNQVSLSLSGISTTPVPPTVLLRWSHLKEVTKSSSAASAGLQKERRWASFHCTAARMKGPDLNLPPVFQLCLDYQLDSVEGQHKTACHCGAPECRKWINWGKKPDKSKHIPWRDVCLLPSLHRGKKASHSSRSTTKQKAQTQRDEQTFIRTEPGAVTRMWLVPYVGGSATRRLLSMYVSVCLVYTRCGIHQRMGKHCAGCGLIAY